MVRKCVAAGCSNTHSDRISLFKFPKDQSLCKKWTIQVKKTRDKWEPSKTSVLCSAHFTEDSFEPDVAIAATFGIEKRRRLKPGAVPTIFKRPGTFCSPSTSTESNSKRRAFEKRERARVWLFTVQI